MWVADCTAPTITSLAESVLKLGPAFKSQKSALIANSSQFSKSSNQDGGESFMTNLANAQEHVPEAECNNCILRSVFVSLIMGLLIRYSHEQLSATW